MKTQNLEKMLVGSVKEILKDRTYFYYSSIGPEYCHLTDKGQEAVLEILNILGGKLRHAEAQEDIERSKELILQELKKE